MTTNQTAISPPPTAEYVGAPPATNRAEPWLTDLNLGAGEDLQPAFFKVDSKKQRVVLLGIKGFGTDGKPVTLRQKDAAGNPVTKEARCYAEVLLSDEATMRTLLWQVLSRPTIAQLRRVLAEHGATWAGELEVDIWGEGRGMNRVTHIVAVKATAQPADEDVAAE